jgi:hypothetical protein
MHGIFVLALAGACASALGLAGSSGCGGPPPPAQPPGTPHGSEAAPGAIGEATPGQKPPADCTAAEAAVAEAKAGAEPDTLAAARFVLAECERARIGAVALDGPTRQAYAQRLEATAAIYRDVIDAGLDKWTIGGWIRTGSLYGGAVAAAGRGGVKADVATWRERAREAFEAGLTAADGAHRDVRFDVEVADWIKAGCVALGDAGRKRFKVCRAWKDAWR